ncbi:hypothetical protein KFL_008660030 [Klebsormidium nitens]|uniref:Uncharacterized protein n=1 Tax=Klebsormidium nitens TaxID=105231 RepID=A0A1Y1IP24_KLENI|nr:hypothetical protein KFL_008660030 [Klebsormidium nitens]|eukprot:GAQ91842.1 hypothetical protein KFL_008660030 [Klebsormidium nitens]
MDADSGARESFCTPFQIPLTSRKIFRQHPCDSSNLQETAGLSEAVSLPRIRVLVRSVLVKGTVRGQRIFRRNAGSVCQLAREACGPKGFLRTKGAWDRALKAAMSGLEGWVGVPESALLGGFRQDVVSTAAAHVEGLKQRGREGTSGGIRGRVQAVRRVKRPSRIPSKRGGHRTDQPGKQSDLHALLCHRCGATAEFGVRGGKEGGEVKYFCTGHVHTTGCFRIDGNRGDWAEDREMRWLRAEERRLEEELRSLGGTSFAAEPAGAMLLTTGGIESNPGPLSMEEICKRSWEEAGSPISSTLLAYLAEHELNFAHWRNLPYDRRVNQVKTLKDAYEGRCLEGWTTFLEQAGLEQAGGAGPSTSGDSGKRQLQGVRQRISGTTGISGTGQWSSAIADKVRHALDPMFSLLNDEGNLQIPCWTPPADHPQMAHISGLAIPQWRGEPSLLLHALPEKEKGRSAADRLIEFIIATRVRYGGQQTQLGRATFGLGVSGCGKTRTALEALCAMFGFYLSFSTTEEPGSNVLAAAVARFRLRFENQLTDFLRTKEGLGSYRNGRLDDAKKLVVRILLVEVLCLERFLKEYGQATPKKYLMMQLIGLGELEDWLVDAWSCVFDVSLEELMMELRRAVNSVKRLRQQDFLLVVVDEAHLGLKSLEDHFPNADNTEGRPLLNAWVRILNDRAFKDFHFLFTGTRLGIAEHESLATAIGKGPGVPVIFSDYGINFASQARSFALEYVPGDDCEEGLWELVAGRYRFVVELTRRRLKSGWHVDWKHALQYLREHHTAENEDGESSQRTLIGRMIALQSSKSYEHILRSLKGLVTDRYIMGVARPQYRKQVDLVELGFCHLVRDEEDKGGEEGWRGRWVQDDEVERLMLKVDLPSPAGLLWDIYMPTALKDFFNPDKILADHPILSSIRNSLPASFFTRPQIVCLTEDGTVSKVTDVEAFRVRRGNKGFGLVDFAEDPRGISFFLPQEGAGPDDANFVQLGNGEPEIWFNILQAKLRPEYELEDALRTVTLDLMYSGHPCRQELLVRLKTGLEQKGVKGIIRIVAAFPSFKTATTEVFHPEESKTRKDDMCIVQIGVSAENAHHFFREDHLNVLKSLKDVKKRAHSEIE